MNGVPIFLAVAEKRSFSAAARALGISPSAASQAVRALEAKLGVPLLVRTTSSVRTTEAGAALAKRAGAALHELDSAMEEAAASGARVAGRLRITAPHIAVEPTLRRALARLFAEHPDLDVEVAVDDRLADIVSEGFDLGVRLSERVPKDFVAVRLTRAFRAVVVGAPSYLAERGRPRHPCDRAAVVGARAPRLLRVLPAREPPLA
jgi:DNA-binding transcriptional LysR family regulator